MTVKFANTPNRKLVERALERFAIAAAKSRSEKVAPDQKDDLESAEKEKSPQNQI